MSTPASRAAFLRRAGAATALVLAPGAVAAQTGPALVTLKLGATPSDDMTPVVYAQKAGIFRKHGLDVQINRLTSGAAVAAGVLSGAFDFGKSSVTTVLEAREKGITFTVVCAPVIWDPKAVYGAFIVAKDSPLQTGKDFNDQLVAVAALGDIGAIALTAWVEQRGGSAKAIRFVEVPFPAAAAAVEAGRVAAAEISNPAMAVALESGKFRTIPAYDGIGTGYLQVAWVTTKDYSTAHPENVRAFTRAFAESVTYTSTHHDETAPLMAEFTGIPIGVIQRMARATAAPLVTPALLQPVIDASAKFGAIKRSFPAQELIDVNAR